MRKKSTFTAKVLATMAITASALLLPQQGWSRIINFEQDDIVYGLNTDTKEAPSPICATSPPRPTSPTAWCIKTQSTR